MIEYHRVATAIMVCAGSHQACSVEMVAIDPRDLESARDQDAATKQSPCDPRETSKRHVVDFDEAGPNEVQMAMTDETIDLDQHRGMAAQKATDLRRLLADVEADQSALRLRQDELEAHLLAAPAADGAKPPKRLAIFSISLPLR